MTRAEMVKDLAERAGTTQAAADRVLDALVDNIIFEVRQNGRYAFTGLGVFHKAARKACQRPNPQKPGTKVNVPAHNTVTFKPSPDFYGKVNK